MVVLFFSVMCRMFVVSCEDMILLRNWSLSVVELCELDTSFGILSESDQLLLHCFDCGPGTCWIRGYLLFVSFCAIAIVEAAVRS